MSTKRAVKFLNLLLCPVASMAIGFSPSPTWLLAGRAIQGVGAAILAPSTLAFLSVLIEKLFLGGALGQRLGGCWFAILCKLAYNRKHGHQ